MSSRARTRATIAAVAVSTALLVPATDAAAGGAQLASAGGGPVATKSGAIVNWVSGFKLRATRRIQPLAVCSVNCDVTGTATLKGMGLKGTFSDSGSFLAGQYFGLYVTVPRQLAKLMRAFPGRFHLVETLTATDPATGGVDSISRSFKFKR